LPRWQVAHRWSGPHQKSIWETSNFPVTFQSPYLRIWYANVLTFSLGLSPQNSSTPDNIRLAYRKLTDTLSAVTGAQAAAISTNVPLMGDDSEIPLWVAGRPRPTAQSDMIWAQMYVTSPDYLAAMGIPLLKGRYFTNQDTKDSQGVVVIDDVMARGLFPGEDPIGKSVGIADTTGNLGNGLNRPLEIVGVVGHVKHWGLDSDDTAKIRYEIYFPFVQIPDQFMSGLSQGMMLLVRTNVDPLSTVTSVKQRIADAGGGDEPAYGFETMAQVVHDSFADRRFSMMLLGVFAALALVLACIGIYGVVAYTASQRIREIGIRMALGAGHIEVLRLVVGQGLTLILSGIAAGLVAAVGLTRLMTSMLFGVRPTDFLTFAAVSVLLALVAVLASYIPAHRAAKVDPMTALRYE
jgi:predicted permease